MNETFRLWDSEEKKTLEVEAKKVGKEWKARCPKHDDKVDSLSINKEKELYNCFGCSFEGHLYNPTQKLTGKPKKKAWEEPIPINYKIMEKRGKEYQGDIPQGIKEARGLTDEVIKQYGIGYCETHPEYLGHKKSITIPIWKDKKIVNIRYHSLIKDADPKILPYESGLKYATWLYPESQLDNDIVIVTEGELDALCCISQGLPAITRTCGATTWKSEFNQYFKNKTVYICQDCDQAGREGAEKIAQELVKIVEEVKIIDLGLDDGQDLTDWFITHNKSKEELQELIKKMPVYKKNEKEKRTPKEKVKEETKTLIPDLIHLVRDNEKVKYLLKNENGLYVQENYTVDDIIYTPKQNLPIKMPTIDILEEPIDIKWNELLEQVVSFIKNYLELPTDTDYLLLALWIFHTYLIEKFNETPILYFYGVKETGKTRAGEVLQELAFRCERLTSPTEATLFRSAHYFKTSLIVDEIKLWGLDGNPEVARLIKSRYKRGLMVSRCNLDNRGEDQIEYFDVFSPLVICTTETIPDTIESRCITFLMQKNARAEVERVIDQDLTRRLRNKLTIFRSNYLEKDLPETDQIARRRLNEIMLPLYQVLMLIDSERKEAFKMIVEGIETAKEEEEGLSLEAEFVKEIIKYQEETRESIFLTTEITERMNKERSGREIISNMLTSSRIKRLGFQKTRLKNGRMGFKINSGLLKKLALQFGLDITTF